MIYGVINGHNDAARIITIYCKLARAKYNTHFFKHLYPCYTIKKYIMVLGACRHHCDVFPGDRNSTHLLNHAFNFNS